MKKFLTLVERASCIILVVALVFDVCLLFISGLTSYSARLQKTLSTLPQLWILLLIFCMSLLVFAIQMTASADAYTENFEEGKKHLILPFASAVLLTPYIVMAIYPTSQFRYAIGLPIFLLSYYYIYLLIQTVSTQIEGVIRRLTKATRHSTHRG